MHSFQLGSMLLDFVTSDSVKLDNSGQLKHMHMAAMLLTLKQCLCENSNVWTPMILHSY